MYKNVLFFIPLMLLFSFSLYAQTNEFIPTLQEALNTEQEVLITLKNSNTFSGRVQSINENSVTIETQDGVFSFKYDRIKHVRIVDMSDISSRWYENPAANKLFLSQTGEMLESGSGYYQNTIIFFSNFAYGLTKNISLDLGFSMIPELGIENQFFSFGMKTGVNLNNNFDISASIKHYRLFGVDVGVTTAFSSGTYSNKRLDLTAGAGLGFAEGESSNILLILGGQFRVTQRFAFASENFILPSGDTDTIPVISFGGRIINTKSVFDLGFFVPDNSDIAIPFASYTIKF